MKTKKTIIAVLAAALVTALFIGCNVLPLEEQNLNNVQKQPAPDGKVRVRINLGNKQSNARTLLPDTDEYADPSDFPYFVLFIYSQTGSDYVSVPTSSPIASKPSVTPYTYITYDAFATDLLLTPGKFSFTVFACSANDGSEDYLAWGETDDSANSNLITISGTNDEVNITLKEIVGASISSTWTDFVSAGKFSWLIDNDDNDLLDYYDTASLSLTEVGGSAYDFDETGGSGVTVLDLKDTDIFTANNDGILTQIPPGYYMMVLTLEKADHQSIYVREIVHIWSGLETKYITDTLPTLRSTVHTVTFNYNDVSNAGVPSSNINHGSTITNNPTHSGTAAGWSFKGWYYDIGLTKPVGTDKIINSIQVYAKWNQVPLLADYTVTKLSQTYGGTLDAVGVSGGSGGTSPGQISAVSYSGKNNLNQDYGPSATLPSNAGTYTASFDVAAATGWDAATLSATLTIAKGTPVAADFDINKLSQTTGKVVEVEIVPKTGSRSKGNITIYYNGYEFNDTSNLDFDTAGTFTVTFDVAADDTTGNWAANTGLSAGTLVVTDPKFFEFELKYSDQPALDAPYNHSNYDTNSKVLTVDVGFDDDPEFDKYEWYVNILDDELTTEAADEYNLQLDINPNTSHYLDWVLALSDDKKFTITLTVYKGGMPYSAEYEFTIIEN
ncbi:InlB B-repeat-containing protein [Treponema sp. R80B11-R83G3]